MITVLFLSAGDWKAYRSQRSNRWSPSGGPRLSPVKWFDIASPVDRDFLSAGRASYLKPPLRLPSSLNFLLLEIPRCSPFSSDKLLFRNPCCRGHNDGRRRLRFGAMLRRASLPAQIKRTVDQTDVAIGLGKIAEHAAALRIELFGEQAHIIAARKQTLEQLAGVRIAALQYVIVDEPKAARQEDTFACGQAIAGTFGLVPQNEFAIDQQFVLDRSKRALDPRIVCGKKADQWNQQQAGVEPLGAIGLHKAVELAVESSLTDLGMNFVGDCAPLMPQLVGCLSFQLGRPPIECHPSHDLRMNEVLAPSAHLPNAFVRLSPSRRQKVKYDRSHCLAAFRWRHTCSQPLKDRVGDLAEDVELQLPGGVIADPHR